MQDSIHVEALLHAAGGQPKSYRAYRSWTSRNGYVGRAIYKNNVQLLVHTNGDATSICCSMPLQAARSMAPGSASSGHSCSACPATTRLTDEGKTGRYAELFHGAHVFLGRLASPVVRRRARRWHKSAWFRIFGWAQVFQPQRLAGHPVGNADAHLDGRKPLDAVRSGAWWANVFPPTLH